MSLCATGKIRGEFFFRGVEASCVSPKTALGVRVVWTSDA